MAERRPTRILHVIKGLGPGGAEQLLVQQLQAGDRQAFDHHVAHLVAEKRHLVPAVEGHGATVHQLSGRAWALELRALAADLRVDVVHAHSPLLASAARLACRTLVPRPRIVTTEHNRWPRHHRLTRLANRATLGLDDHTVAVSADVRSTMPGRATVEVLTHGIDVAAVRAGADRIGMRRSLGLAEGDFVAVNVANLRPEKDHAVLLTAAARAAATCDRFRLVVVGQGPRADAVRAHRDELGLDGRVLLLGYRPDAVAVMAAADVFTLSSRHEGLPVALMEALALGLPVVATRAGGVPQAVSHDVEARLVAVGDAAGLAREWLRLADDPALASRLAIAAAAAAPAFDARRSTERLEQIYRSLSPAGAASSSA